MTKYLFVFLAVAVVALGGLAFYLHSENTASVVLASRCLIYAKDFDRVAQNSFMLVFNEKGYSTQQSTAYDYCAGQEAPGVATYFMQNMPMQVLHRFEFVNGDIYGYRGGPEAKLGYIQYYICNDGRARVLISGRQICSTL